MIGETINPLTAMKHLVFLFILGCLPALGLGATEPVATEKEPLTPAQIDELLAPIALYPDPLIAIILPASTFPTDIVLAARHLKEGEAAGDIESQTWDDSVKALARYPEVVHWMDENLDWTRQLGSAFLLQPAAMLNGTQRLRAAAIAAGNLKDTPEQTVIVEREVIRIVPAQREVIYVPIYDPVLVYRPWPVHHVHYSRPRVTFSIGYSTGFWLSYHFNWVQRSVVVIDRPARLTVWHRYPTWSYPAHTVVHHHHHHTWKPAPARVQIVRREFQRRPDYRPARPTTTVRVQPRPERTASPRDFVRPTTENRKRPPAAIANRNTPAPVINPATAPSQQRRLERASSPNPIERREARRDSLRETRRDAIADRNPAQPRLRAPATPPPTTTTPAVNPQQRRLERATSPNPIERREARRDSLRETRRDAIVDRNPAQPRLRAPVTPPPTTVAPAVNPQQRRLERASSPNPPANSRADIKRRQSATAPTVPGLAQRRETTRPSTVQRQTRAATEPARAQTSLSSRRNRTAPETPPPADTSATDNRRQRAWR